MGGVFECKKEKTIIGKWHDGRNIYREIIEGQVEYTSKEIENNELNIPILYNTNLDLIYDVKGNILVDNKDAQSSDWKYNISRYESTNICNFIYYSTKIKSIVLAIKTTKEATISYNVVIEYIEKS